MDTQVVIVLVVAVLAAIGVAAWLYLRKRRSDELRQSSGPEDDHARHVHPRQLSAEQLQIRALSSDERDGFTERWRSAQAQFVDDPRGATRTAEALVAEVMQVRGYPAGDFEQRAADVSVDHPRVVEHVRAAHAIIRRNDPHHDDGLSDSEHLRQAFVDLRALFDDLLVDDLLDVQTAVSEARR